jgi:8-hydroxy-5-deazaflavin:NADPH oxidoreductase
VNEKSLVLVTGANRGACSLTLSNENKKSNIVKITFIGIGNVGSALADGLAQAGHSIVIAARDSSSQTVENPLSKIALSASHLPPKPLTNRQWFSWQHRMMAASKALSGLNLKGKILVDCTNPVGPGISHGLQSKSSGSEEIQKLAPYANVVKAFTIVGYENFENSSYPGYGELKPVMLIAGDDTKAKDVVSQFAAELGWRAQDAGPLSSALHLEHICRLWVKIARVQGKGPNFVWSILER